MALPDPLITATKNRLSGAPVFAGTRVPVQNLFDYLEGGDSLDEFLSDFPNVTRDHAVAVLACRLGQAFGATQHLAAEFVALGRART